MVRHKLPLFLLVLAVVALAACSSSSSTGGTGAGSSQITIKGNEFKFDPSQVTWKVNQPVQLVFQNTGTTDHELDLSAIPAKDVKIDLGQAGNVPADAKSKADQDAQAGKVYLYAAANQQATATFTPTQAGTYDFACNLPGHKEAGMVGKATVQ